MVIVNPTAPVGDHDVKPTPTGKIVLDFLNGDMPAFIDTGLNVVDVRDVGRGSSAGLRAGPAGRALYPGVRKSDAGADSAKAGADHRPEGATRAACRTPVAWLRGGRVARLGRGSRASRRACPWTPCAWHARRCGSRIEKAERELGFRPGPADAALRAPWSGFERPRLMKLLVVAADRMEFAGLHGQARARPLGMDWCAGRASASRCCWLPTAWETAAAAAVDAMPLARRDRQHWVLRSARLRN